MKSEEARDNAQATMFMNSLLFRRYTAKLHFELDFWSRFAHDGGTPSGYAERLLSFDPDNQDGWSRYGLLLEDYGAFLGEKDTYYAAACKALAKAMDDCIVAYGMNGEAVRPQQGFPLRLMVPGFEGIFHTKYLRRIKVVDRYYMNYNDYGHLDRDSKTAALGYQIGPKSVITFPSGGQQLPGKADEGCRSKAGSPGQAHGGACANDIRPR